MGTAIDHTACIAFVVATEHGKRAETGSDQRLFAEFAGTEDQVPVFTR